MVIAIDGHSSCGKSTFAKAVARRYSLVYIDTGAMYRAVTLAVMHNKAIKGKTINKLALEKLIDKIYIEFRYDASTDSQHLWLNNEDVENEIRSPEVNDLVSIVSAEKLVRERLVILQRQMARNQNVVLEGRDIGTVVFPHADIKIFLTASAEVRAQRRFDEFRAKGIEITYDQVLGNLTERDHIDQTRTESPLRKADDAIVLDNSFMTPKEQLDWLETTFADKLIKIRNT